MIGVLLLCILPSLAAAAPAAAAGGKAGAMLSSAPTPTKASTSTGRGGGGGGGKQRIDPRQVPPLDPEREVNEQDCTKPLEPSRGNLKCK